MKTYWVPLVYEQISKKIKNPEDFIKNIKEKAYRYDVGTYGIYEHWWQFGTVDKKYDFDGTYRLAIIVGGEKEKVENFTRDIIEEFGMPEKPRILFGAFTEWFEDGNIRGRRLLRKIIKQLSQKTKK